METLKLSDIRKELPFQIHKETWGGYLQDWKDGGHRYSYKLDFDVYLPSKGKNLQRGFCWNLDQKRELIFSVIKGVDIQPITIIICKFEDSSVVYKVVDGKQRFSTLIDFIGGKFTIVWKGKEYSFEDLPEDIKQVIRMFDIHFNQTYEYWDDMISDDNKIAWFEMINFVGTPQDIEHLNNLKK